ncbi:hypothetical protein HPB47_002914 [Ixodes persulcatus]|uniref:Uncharacterized protein n=1 Tax=Ixodes persulcatus TaxID=34615 RepID=A0AC60PJY1_IXOPE|nr:hypothetical protein HPB47_002914 [Ixodes persulcatus]
MTGNEKAHLLARETLHGAPDIPRSVLTFPVALPSLESYRQARRVFLLFTLTSHATEALSYATPKVTPSPPQPASTFYEVYTLRILPPASTVCGDRPKYPSHLMDQPSPFPTAP